MEKMMFSGGDKILLAGDSITDCGRSSGPDPLGEGYVRFFSDILCAARPDLEVECANRGVSGNTIIDLAERWDMDALSQRPGWLSIMIGINDIHRYLNGQAKGVSPARFRAEYDALLEKTVSEIGCRLVLMDPFYICAGGNGDPLRQKVLELLPEYLAATADMAGKYGAVHVKTHEAFLTHLKYRPAEVFCPEPVHPNRTGHMIIAWELYKALLA